MSWTAFHSRGEILRAVVDAANHRRDGVLPAQVPGVAENFTDEIDLLGALLLKWHARLSGNIERAMSREPMDLETAVAAAWRATAEQEPGLRLVLDRCAAAPQTAAMSAAMRRAREREWQRLAVAAGLARGQGPRAAEVGRRVERAAREGLELGGTTAAPKPAPQLDRQPDRQLDRQPDRQPDRGARESFVDRIKAALAA